MENEKDLVWHMHPLRVRYQETDQMGVVFYGNYASWFEVGRTEWIRSHGMSYDTLEQQGVLLPVIDFHCRYVQGARYDDIVLICTRISSLSPLRLSFESQARLVPVDQWQGGQWTGLREQLPGKLLAAGETQHVWVNKEMQPLRLHRQKPDLYELLQKLLVQE